MCVGGTVSVINIGSDGRQGDISLSMIHTLRIRQVQIFATSGNAYSDKISLRSLVNLHVHNSSEMSLSSSPAYTRAHTHTCVSDSLCCLPCARACVCLTCVRACLPTCIFSGALRVVSQCIFIRQHDAAIAGLIVGVLQAINKDSMRTTCR